MRLRVAFICLLIALAASSASAASTLVYRVDKASAMIAHGRLVVTVVGVVRTGGWKNATLRQHGTAVPEARTLELEFVATPPRRGAVVVQTILPVWTKVRLPLPRYGTTEVKILTETNEMTVPVVPQRQAQRNAAK